MEHAIVEEQVLRAITKQRELDIRKALEAHCRCCRAYEACKRRVLFRCEETRRIRKAMEE